MALNAFPFVAKSFINSYSGTVKYVDIANGSDSNSGDTEATAYQTLGHAQSETSAINTPVMYVINPGIYTLTNVTLSGFGEAMFVDGNLPRIIFCAPDGQVIFRGSGAIGASAGARDFPPISFQNSGSAIYNCVLERDNGGRTDSYQTAFFNGSTTHCQGDFYNCVFKEINANGNWSLQYDNGGANNATVNNCTFYTIENGANDYSGTANLVLNDCAFNYNYGTGSAAKNNTVVNQTIDATTYALSTDNTTYGVYSGTYAWGQPLNYVDFQVGGVSVTNLNEGDTVTVLLRGSTETGSRNYTISGISSADIGGASLSGSVNLVNFEASLTLTLSNDISSGEGSEELTVLLADPAGNVQNTINVFDTSAVLFVTPTAVSGDTITVRLNTSNTPEANGTEIPFTISGLYITSANIGRSLTGNFTISNNISQFTFTLGAVPSTTLIVTAYGETAECSITFASSFPDDVVTQTTQPIYQSAMIASLLDGVETPIGNGVPNAQQISDYQVKPIPKPDGEEVMVWQTVTTSNNGRYNQFVNLPLGAEIIKEYWI